ncbi:MAG: hypothetical protein V3U87_06315 [Methylococcaceae bacterium]
MFIADYPNEYVETNENNNTAQVAIEVVENTTVSFNLDLDGDGEVKPLTDGLLSLRYQFGFRGDALVNSAISPSATRKTAEEIETYLIEGGLSLDIDGDGEIKPLTDGLLTLRYLFGFRGDTLINNAIDANATRKTSQAVEIQIQALMP